MAISNLTDDELKRKLRRGRAWLRIHDRTWSEKLGWRYDEARWKENFDVYTHYLAQAKEKGVTEADAWNFEHGFLLVDENLTFEEACCSLLLL